MGMTGSGSEAAAMGPSLRAGAAPRRPAGSPGRFWKATFLQRGCLKVAFLQLPGRPNPPRSELPGRARTLRPGDAAATRVERHRDVLQRLALGVHAVDQRDDPADDHDGAAHEVAVEELGRV